MQMGRRAGRASLSGAEWGRGNSLSCPCPGLLSGAPPGTAEATGPAQEDSCADPPPSLSTVRLTLTWACASRPRCRARSPEDGWTLHLPHWALCVSGCPPSPPVCRCWSLLCVGRMWSTGQRAPYSCETEKHLLRPEPSLSPPVPLLLRLRQPSWWEWSRWTGR